MQIFGRQPRRFCSGAGRTSRVAAHAVSDYTMPSEYGLLGLGKLRRAELMKIRSCATLAVAVALPFAVLFAATTGASAQALGAIAGTAKAATPESAVEKVQRRRGRAGRNLGIGLGILGAAIILNEAARAEGRRRYSRDSHCGRLLYRCESGSDWSCEKYEDRCM